MGSEMCIRDSTFTADQSSCAEDTFVWTSATCSSKIQIYPSNKVGVIDPETLDTSNMWPYMSSSGNSFGIRWDNLSAVPIAANGCGPGCNQAASVDGETCVCDITVVEAVPFDGMSIPTVSDIESNLFVGAVSPSEVYDSGVYEVCGMCSTTPPNIHLSIDV